MSGPTGLRRFVTEAGTAPTVAAGSATATGSATTTRPATASATATGSATTTRPATASATTTGPAVVAQSSPAAGPAPAPAGLPTAISAAWEGPGQAGRSAEAAPAEKCELCATEIPAEHGHVADLEQSSLVCACRACYLLFTHSQAGRGRYRAVPDRYLADPAHPLSAAEWDALEIPIGLAFFLRRSETGEVTGFYPSPAGATECKLDLAAWDRLAESHPLLAEPADDVEATLISRNENGVDCFLVPIDACYELAGRMRLHWRGFDGGTEARQAIADFLAGLRARARPLRQESRHG